MTTLTLPTDFHYPEIPKHVDMTDEEWEEFCDKRMATPGYIVLGVLPGEEWYNGVVEHSFSMGIDTKRVRLWWTGKAVDNVFGKTWDLEGWKNAKHYADWMEKTYRGTRAFVFDAHDEELLPVKLDWRQWLYDTSPPAPGRKFSMVHNKFGDRNIRFEPDTSQPFIL